MSLNKHSEADTLRPLLIEGCQRPASLHPAHLLDKYVAGIPDAVAIVESWRAPWADLIVIEEVLA